MNQAMAANPLLTGAIAPTILRLASPTMIAMLATTCVAIAETSYVARLGVPALAGLALVFPLVMLQQMLSGGAMGGGVSAAIARALGAGERERARALAFHAALIGAGAGVAFAAIIFVFGDGIFEALGGRGAALQEAHAYARAFAPGAFFIWTTNILASILRGCGDMRTPSFTLIGAALAQICLGGALGLGLGPFPHLGMTGVGLGVTLAFCGASVFLWLRLSRASARLRLSFADGGLDRALFADILRVGALACASPLQSVATVLILTRYVANYGVETLAGYGVGSRLEFLLIPIAFAIGVACVPMVGMAVGARRVERARAVAWTGAAMAGAGLGAIGLIFWIAPDLWGARFSSDPQVLSAQWTYMRWTALAYAPYGVALCLYFASQGAGKVLGPVLAQGARLLVVAVGGWIALRMEAGPEVLFALAGLSFFAYGAATAAIVRATPWGPRD